MKIKQLNLKMLCLFACLISSNLVFSNIIYSANSTAWNLTTTWQGGVVPTSTDTVIIQGHDVSLVSMDSFSVKKLEIINSGTPSRLFIQESAKLHVLGNFIMTSNDFDSEVILQIKQNTALYVNGNLVVNRQSPSYSKKCQIHMINSSKIKVYGNFTFNYVAAKNGEIDDEILMEDIAKLEVGGVTTFNMTGGKDFHIELKSAAHLKLNGGLTATMTSGEKAYIYSDFNSHVEITGNVLLQNLSSGSNVYGLSLTTGMSGGNITINGDLTLKSNKSDALVSIASIAAAPTIKVVGDLIFDADFENTAHVYLEESATFQFGGNIRRPTSDFGRIYMAPNATFEFNGTTPQTIPQNKLSGSGADSLLFTNQKFNNSNGYNLDGPITIYNNLNLENGVIVTDITNKIIFADGATFTGGNDTSYIQGPITKIGAVAGDSFIFPSGYNGKYAPVEIKPLATSPTSEYTAQYFKCPPPYGLSLTSPLAQISGNQFWKVDRTITSADFDLTLHWMDANAEGISDTSLMMVAGLNDATVGAEVWEPMGKAEVILSGLQGSVTNDEKCPPPYGRTIFTLGTKAGNALPSELISFKVKKNGNDVVLDWVTATETNSDYFVVEKSTDGRQFKKITSVAAQGNSTTLQYYSAIDKLPTIGINYYRLQRVDQDGMSSPTNTIAIKIEEGSNPQITVFPNPIHEDITIETVDFLEEDMNIEVFFQNGQKVYEGKITFGNRKFIASAADLNIKASGTYMILYYNSRRAKSLKFVKM